MKWVDRLLSIAAFWEQTRQIGHTTAMVSGAVCVPNTLIVIANQQEKRTLDRLTTKLHGDASRLSTATIYELPDRLRGHVGPVIVDHHAMMVLIKEAVAEMREQISEVKRTEGVMP